MPHFQNFADRIGILSSSLCLLHCLTLPILITTQPIIGQFIEEELFFTEYIFMLLSLIAVFFSVRTTPFLLMKVSFVAVFVAFNVGIFLEHDYPQFSYLAYIASSLLIVLHISNIYFLKIYPTSCYVHFSDRNARSRQKHYSEKVGSTHAHSNC